MARKRRHKKHGHKKHGHKAGSAAVKHQLASINKTLHAIKAKV